MNSKLFDAPQIDSATMDYYLARGRQERARAFSAMIRSIFSSPQRHSAEIHALPKRERAAPSPAGERARAA